MPKTQHRYVGFPHNDSDFDGISKETYAQNTKSLCGLDLEKENYKLFDKIIYSDYNNFVDTCIKYIKLNQIDRDNISNDIYNWLKKNHSLSKYLPIGDILKIK